MSAAPNPQPLAAVRLRVIGVGSPFGDDAVGLEAARRLGRRGLPGADVVAADRPGLGLIEMIGGVESVILLDAARSPGAPAGSLHDLDLHDLRAGAPRLTSSHGVGVIEALRLAAELERLPRRGRLLAVEVESAAPGAPLGAAGEEAVGTLVERARRWAEHYLDSPVDEARKTSPRADAR